MSYSPSSCKESHTTERLNSNDRSHGFRSSGSLPFFNASSTDVLIDLFNQLLPLSQLSWELDVPSLVC